MTETAVESESPVNAASDEQLIAILVGRARCERLQLTTRVLESALEGEIIDHLSYDKSRQREDKRGPVAPHLLPL